MTVPILIMRKGIWLLGLVVFLDMAGAEWHRYLVDNSSPATGTCVQVSNGIPYIAYYNDAGLNLARWNQTGWHIDTIDHRPSYHNRGPSLVFDRSGNPQIAFFCGTPWHAYLDSEAWFVEEIDTDSAGDYISLAIDARNRMQAAYNQGGGLAASWLKYAWRDSLGWHREVVDSSGGYDCVLRFDTAGVPCVGHCESWSNGALYYFRRTGNGWVKDTVLADYASQSSLVLDNQGDPHFSYYWTDGTNYDLRYCDRVGGAWRFDVVDHGLQLYKRGWDNCIARAGDGSYHISYHCHNEGQLRYAHGNYGGWQVTVVDSAVGLWDLFSSIALDNLDRPYVAYCNSNQNDALYLASLADLTGQEEKPAADGVRPMLAIGPNPCMGVLSLRLAGNSRRLARNAKLVMHDATGREVRRLDIEGAAEMHVDMRALPAGVYFIGLDAADLAARQRIVKLK